MGLRVDWIKSSNFAVKILGIIEISYIQNI